MRSRVEGLFSFMDRRYGELPGFRERAELARMELEAEICRYEEEAAAHRSVYYSLFKATNDCVAIYKAVDGGEDFRFVDFNPSAEAAENTPKEHLLGKKVTEVFPAVVEFGLLEVFRRVFRTGEAESHPLGFYEDNRVKGWRDNFVYRLDEEHIVAVYRDRTREKQDEEQLRLSSKVFETAIEGMLITDGETNLVAVNDAFVQITGYGKEELVGKRAGFLKSQHHDEAFYREMWAQIEKEGHWSGEILDRRKDGALISVFLIVTAIRNGEGKATNYVGIYHDVTAQKEAERQVHRLAYYDPLTRLPNRALLQDRADHAIAMARRNRSLVAFHFIDLDNFKNVNDTLGHRAGDLLLAQVAARIGGQIRESDTLARLGGDEFLLLQENLEHGEDALRTGEKIREVMNLPFELEGETVYASASVGISLYPENGSNLEELMREADIAMYKAKEKGKNGFEFYAPRMQETIMARRELENGLRRALEEERLELYYQPQVDAGEKRVVGVEALLRWNDPDKGFISPELFIPVAEHSGLMDRIERWVLTTAARRRKSWLEEGIDLPVSINVSHSRFFQEEFVRVTKELIRNEGVDWEGFDLELTERIVMDEENAAAKLEELKACGFTLSLDDFGTGHSSLAYLKKFQIDKLKIDKSFIREIPGDRQSCDIARAIISLANTLGMETVAEGVETREHEAFLKANGCRIAQGYLYARPMPPEEIAGFLERFVP